MNISKMAIYPPLGIARVGNSSEFFLASNLPGQAPVPANGFKDDEGKVKKQAALFRVYALADKQQPIQEVTSADGALITWRVHVANRKAGWYQFMNALDLPGQAIPGAPRNNAVTGDDRKNLIIDPGPRSICGNNISGSAYRFDGGKFYGTPVDLGEVRTDEKGRLTIIGGNGISAPKNAGVQATTFANNDNWHDDVADGTVRASVQFNGQTYEADPAMIAVTPPNFGPGLFSTVTMYDVVTDLFVRSGWIKEVEKIIFYEHIYPILERTVQAQWVNHGSYILFGQNSPSDFTAPELLKQLSDPSPASRDAREKVFRWYRKPDGGLYEPAKIPPYYGDAFGDYSVEPNIDLPLTLTQYSMMEQWASGNFETGSLQTAILFDHLSPGQQVEALTRAPLEECLGGPFHPGIEITWPFRNLIFWQSPYKIKMLSEGQDPQDDYGPLLSQRIALGVNGPLDGSGPGSLTRWLGVPWQTDGASCLSGYDTSLYLMLPSFWATRVPNHVLSEQSFTRISDTTLREAQKLKHFDYRQDWLRDFGTQYIPKINRMVERWHELGIVVAHPFSSGRGQNLLPDQLWVESDRTIPPTDFTLEQVKIAEEASKKEETDALQVLADIAGRKLTTPRPVRKRRTFRRDEM
ncbi:MAG: LodA/GoxA family CTQ-dependent oxidase [Williamsia sp.]|nr:LodA/GoxA family CTQ-dependent oxidase [Williamsia sp.]